MISSCRSVWCFGRSSNLHWWCSREKRSWIVSEPIEELQGFDCTSFFLHSILFQVTYTNKELQNDSVDISVGLKSFERLCEWLKSYRDTRFDDALINVNALEVEPVFQRKSMRTKARLLDMNLLMNQFQIPNKSQKLIISTKLLMRLNSLFNHG